MWRGADVNMSRCEDEQMWRWADVKMSRCEDEKVWRWEDVKMRRCEDEKMWRWEGVKMRRCERRCEDEKVWRWDVKRSRCEDEQMWRWADVKMSRCEDEKVWRWEDVKMRRCEDEKVWRWEDEIQTPTIGRTLRSDALGKNIVHFMWLAVGSFFLCTHELLPFHLPFIPLPCPSTFPLLSLSLSRFLSYFPACQCLIGFNCSTFVCALRSRGFSYVPMYFLFLAEFFFTCNPR